MNKTQRDGKTNLEELRDFPQKQKCGFTVINNESGRLQRCDVFVLVSAESISLQ